MTEQMALTNRQALCLGVAYTAGIFLIGMLVGHFFW